MTPSSASSVAPGTAAFEVNVSKEDFKFHAAHFVAFNGFREPLHGHNYKVGVRLLGHRQIGSDGYLIDFGDVKRVTKEVCKKLNNHFLCPMMSDVMSITISKLSSKEENGETPNKQQITLVCQDGSFFSFPLQDVAQLPIVHATSEELAIYIWSEILKKLQPSYLRDQRGIHTMEITVMEAPGQDARFSYGIPSNDAEKVLDVSSFIGKSGPPAPCLVARQVCCPDCTKINRETKQQVIGTSLIEKLTNAMNKAGVTQQDSSPLTCQDVEKFLTDSLSPSSI